MTNADKARKTLLGIDIPRRELAFRIMQQAVGATPPPGTTAKEAFELAERAAPGMTAIFYAQADAAIHYFHECIKAARQPS